MYQSTAVPSNCLTQSETNLLPVFKGASLHPCTDDTAHHLVARLHLPIALRCNTHCYYCEKRVLADDRCPVAPGITSRLLSPIWSKNSKVLRPRDLVPRRFSANYLFSSSVTT